MSRIPRSSREASSVGALISEPGHSLSSVLAHAQVLTRIHTVLRGLTDPETANQFQVANLRQGHLILITPTATWATRLRMQTPQLLQSLQSSGYPHLRHIDIRVAPIAHQPVQNRLRRRPSVEAERTLENFRRLTEKPDP